MYCWAFIVYTTSFNSPFREIHITTPVLTMNVQQYMQINTKGVINMTTSKKKSNGSLTKKSMDPEAREKQIVSKAYSLAEKQIEEGTASSGVIMHFLKLGSNRYEVEIEKLKKELDLVTAKTDQIQYQQSSAELAQQAIDAIKKYSGRYDDDGDE